VNVRGYLLDTQTVWNWFDAGSGRYPTVKAAADRRAAEAPLYVSAVTLGEIEYGHAQHPPGAGPNRAEFVTFVHEKFQLPQILAVSKHSTEPYGRIRACLVAKFPPVRGWSQNKKKRAEQMYDPVAARELGIDENDLWLTAQAVERNLILVTSDKMRKIREAVAEVAPNFAVEDWAGDSPDTQSP
jgi:predicted nucleic acid-binding protein